MRKVIALSLICMLVFSLAACQCSHDWQEATCTTPKTCSLCGETEGEVLPHEWVAATCTEPMTCFVCKATEGEPLGHEWEDATCTSPKTCAVCGETEGTPLGHKLEDTTEISPSTCSQPGSVEGTCSVCGKTLTEELPLLDHVPGEQEIGVEATYDAGGTKVVKCLECGEILEEESYELTAEEKEAWYKNACETVLYEDFARTPDDYLGKRVKITAQISYCIKEAESENDHSIYYVNTKESYGYYVYEPMYIFVSDFDSPSRILTNDIITFYGELDGLYKEYGTSEPKLIAAYYDLVS